MAETQDRLLVVDDDAEIRRLLVDYLCRNGFSVRGASGGEELFQALEEETADLVVLDIMMPGEDGLSLCRRLREGSAMPVIFLTALDSVTDRVVGLEIGADDYVVKPFEPRELLARIRTVLRRGKSGDRVSGHDATDEANPGGTRSGEAADRTWLRFAGWRLDPLSREFRDADDVRVELSDAQFRLLMIFLEQPFQILSRDALLTRLHGREQEPFDRSVDIQVSRLRARLRDTTEPRLIRTVRGGGYMLAVEVERKPRSL